MHYIVAFFADVIKSAEAGALPSELLKHHLVEHEFERGVVEEVVHAVVIARPAFYRRLNDKDILRMFDSDFIGHASAIVSHTAIAGEHQIGVCHKNSTGLASSVVTEAAAMIIHDFPPVWTGSLDTKTYQNAVDVLGYSHELMRR